MTVVLQKLWNTVYHVSEPFFTDFTVSLRILIH